MNIEKDIFESAKLQLDKLEKYGFKKDNDVYSYSKNIMDNKFRVDITIDSSNNIFGKIYELETQIKVNHQMTENIKEIITRLEKIKNKELQFEPRREFTTNQTAKKKYYSSIWRC